ncbi:phage tail tape measure protein [Streptomyces apocyni]|uniref:hypothetical protein n=1 Tax=Streptomyces apocyni TaxID=2654677 RepID=UPI0012EA840C|nr:hypothetical protein [Streptomyces apocyni]
MAVLDELLVRLGVDMSEADDEIDRGSRRIEGRLNGLTAVGGAAAVGLGAAFVMGLESAMDITSVTDQLQNQLDLTDNEAARAGAIAGDVFADGFGGSLGEVGEALDSVASSMHEFGSISDKEMQQLTKEALALEKAFKFDVAEAAVGAGNMIKSGLAKDGAEAMDLLAATAQKLPTAMREELPVLTKEYSEFFGQLGFTGPQMMGLLAEASKNPLFEIDKLADSIKEFALRVADTDAVSEPLKELGLDVKDIQKLVNTGKGTQAFDEVNEALLKVGDQTKRTALQAELFGGPGEDIGNTLQAISEAGGAGGASLGDFAGKAGEMATAMENSPAQQFDALMRTVSTTLGEMLLPALRFVSELFKEHPGLLQVAIPLILAIAAALTVAAIAQWAMNSALLASPVTWIIVAIALIIAAIVLIATKTTWFQDLWRTVWGGIKGAAEAVGRWFSGTLMPWITGVFTGIGRGAGNMWRTIKGWWDTLVSYISGIPGRISRIASGMWDGVKSAFRSAINWIIGKWNGFSFSIGGGSFMGVSIPRATISTPDIPYLADGGIVTGPTLAMIGEGREDEAVLPLSKLDQLLTAQSPAARMVQPAETRMTIGFEPGGDDLLADLLQEIIRVKFGGDVDALRAEA